MDCRTGALVSFIERSVKDHGAGRENLLPVLRDVNDEFGYVSGSALIEISRVMDISIGEIHGVATFYSFINVENKGSYVIRLCKTISCDMKGKEKIEKTLERELGIKFGETSSDGLFRLEYSNCMGMCDKGPAMLVNNKLFDSLTPESVLDIVSEYRRKRL
ncbi:MAG TPA: NAD(P)H-dependent oxidoreductase subunit E [bacterium]|nr:NAD(P)H-dependent oxidoreductase subunit E [bacterium]HPS30983.1 NAD(P)H-dependent oxidoreductase subunit E [bacterium]